MVLIKADHLNFQYESIDEPLFSDLSFSMDTSWKCGLIGKNGEGKTTLVKLLNGQLHGQGNIECSVPCALFPFSISNPKQMTMEVLEEATGALNWKIEKECSQIGLRPDVVWQPFETLSCGEQVRAMLAALFASEHTFVILDEPSNHLDEQARRKLAMYLKTKNGFLIVSHDRQLLDECVDHLLVLEEGQIEVRKGNFSSWDMDHKNQLVKDQADNERLHKEIKRLDQAARTSRIWSDAKEKKKIGAADKGYVGHKAAKLMKRSKVVEARKVKAIEQKKKLLHTDLSPESLKIRSQGYKKEIFVRFENVCVDYKVWQSTPQTFTIQRGDRILLCGPNGSGKSSLIKALLKKISYKGKILVSNDLHISYVEQTYESVSGNMEDYIEQYGIDRTRFLTTLRKFGFSRDELFHPLDQLSSGQRRKIMLARSLCEEAHLYVWDEPLNDLDITTREQLEQMLEEGEYTMLFVEHDPFFCKKIASRYINMNQN